LVLIEIHREDIDTLPPCCASAHQQAPHPFVL
jgi:hypothetical protein